MTDATAFTARTWTQGQFIGYADNQDDADLMARVYAADHSVRTFVVDRHECVSIFDPRGNRQLTSKQFAALKP